MTKLSFAAISICSECQRSCVGCIHSTIIKADPTYQLSMDGLRTIIEHIKLKDVRIGTFELGGAGDPALWKNLEEGTELLCNSGICDRLNICTNGVAFDRIIPVIDKFHKVHVSSYPLHTNWDTYVEYARKYPNVMLQKNNGFIPPLRAGAISKIPCNCFSPGPLFEETGVLPTCGLPYYNTVEYMESLDAPVTDIKIPLDGDWLTAIETMEQGNLEICRYCQANTNSDGFKYYREKRLYEGRRYKFIDELESDGVV